LAKKNGFGKIKKIFEELFKTLLFLVLAPPPHPFQTFPNSHFFPIFKHPETKQTNTPGNTQEGRKQAIFYIKCFYRAVNTLFVLC